MTPDAGVADRGAGSRARKFRTIRDRPHIAFGVGGLACGNAPAMEDVMKDERGRDLRPPDHVLRDIERAVAALPVDPAWLASYFLTPGPVRRARLVIALARTVAIAVSEARASAGEAPAKASIESRHAADRLIDIDRYSRLAARLLMKRLGSGAGKPAAPAVVTMDYTP
jgi:hypothetical protein